MRPAPWRHLASYRRAGVNWEASGMFLVPHGPTGVTLRIIASSGEGWEHVSVSLPNRTPNWREMEFACRLFWAEEEAVMQLHPPRAQWVNNHPTCLHLWRPTDPATPIPLPPPELVGIPGRSFDPRRPADVAEARAAFRLFNGGAPA